MISQYVRMAGFFSFIWRRCPAILAYYWFTGKTEIKGIGMTGRRVSIYWTKRNLGGKWPVEE